jgi:o-succinylbenzoate---CoA ligase
MQSRDNISKFIPTIRITNSSVSSERLKEIREFIEDWHSNETTILLKTSGSTGKPKEFVVPKPYLAASARMTISYFGLTKGMNLLHCLSISSIAGKMQIIRAILAELNILVAEVSSTPLEKLNETVHFTAMVPLQVEQTLEKNAEKLDLIETLIIGGAAINGSTWDSLVQRNQNAFQTFGMTETYSHIAIRKICSPEIPYEVLDGVRISAHPNLVINAPHLGLENLETNDVIELLDENHFYWKGRADFVINSGGIKIHPEQVEIKLGPFINIPFFSIGIPDEKFGTLHVLCLEGWQRIEKESIQKALQKYEVPKFLYFFKKFDYTHSGKIDRNKTLERLDEAQREIL